LLIADIVLSVPNSSFPTITRRVGIGTFPVWNGMVARASMGLFPQPFWMNYVILRKSNWLSLMLIAKLRLSANAIKTFYYNFFNRNTYGLSECAAVCLQILRYVKRPCLHYVMPGKFSAGSGDPAGSVMI